MELRHLRYFTAVAEELSFTRAANRLHTAQPSLSQQIRHLEDEIGTPLFERDTRRVQLTAAGRALLKETREILGRTDHLVELAFSAASGNASELSVGVSALAEVKIVPRIVPIMRKRHPKISLVFHSTSADEQLAGLRDYSIDIAFLWGPRDEPDLTTEEVLREEIVVVMPAGHELAKMRRVSIQMLGNMPSIGISRKAPPALHDILVSLYKQAGVRVRRAHEADSVFGHLNMVAAGLGYALLPEYVKSIMPRGVVAKTLHLDPPPHLSLVSVCRKGDTLPALHAFRNIVRECFGKRWESPAPNGRARPKSGKA
jgi:LysR family transcriptional regulator, hca operon transcriptional activator